MSTNRFISHVVEFHRSFGAPIGKQPRMIETKRFLSRQKWAREELDEMTDAFLNGDLAKIGDGIADAIYFLIGTAVEMGLHHVLDDIFDAVQDANMRKMVRGRHGDLCPVFRGDHENQVRCTCGAILHHPDGKVKKPEGWYAPDDQIETIVAHAINKAEDQQVYRGHPSSYRAPDDDL